MTIKVDLLPYINCRPKQQPCVQIIRVCAPTPAVIESVKIDG